MAKPYVTVAQAVRLTGVSERTIRADIASGRLTVLRLPNGRIHIHREALQQYRGRQHRGAMTVERASQAFGVSVRTLRRWIASGKVRAVRLSPHRVAVVVGRVRRGVPAGRDANLQVSRSEEGGPAPEPRAPTHDQQHFLMYPKEVAELAGKTLRAVYYDIEKGALPILFRTSERGKIHIRREDAEAYAK